MQETSGVEMDSRAESADMITLDFKDRHEMSVQFCRLLLDHANDLVKLTESTDLVIQNLDDILNVVKKVSALYKTFSRIKNMEDVTTDEMDYVVTHIARSLEEQGIDVSDAKRAISGLEHDGLTKQESDELTSLFHDIGNDVSRLDGSSNALKAIGEDSILLEALKSTSVGLKEKLEHYLDQDQNRKTNALAFLDVVFSLQKEMQTYAPMIGMEFSFTDSSEMSEADLEQYQVDFHPVSLRGAFTNALQNILRINDAYAKEGHQPPITNLTVNVGLVQTDTDHPGIVITLDDNGPGFPQSDKQNIELSLLDNRQVVIYEPELGKTHYSESVSGTGVALASLENELQEHDGDLLVGSVMDGDNITGARVELRIPLVKSSAAAVAVS